MADASPDSSRPDAALFALDEGGGSTAIVFLHGFGGSHGLWSDQLRRLAGGVRALAYDLPGHGGSLDHPAARSARAMAEAIWSDLATRGVARVRLVGHSLGGAVAALMAAAAPDNVAATLLLAPGGFGPDIAGDLIRRYALARTAAELSAALAAMSAPTASVSAESVALLEAMRAAPKQVETLEAMAGWIARGDTQGAFPPTLFQALATPLTIAWGTADPVLPYVPKARLPETVRLVTIEGAGHMLIEEHPETVAGLIAALPA